MNQILGVYVVIWNPRIGKLLVLHRVLHWSGWECVKGHQDEGELEGAAKREVQEETGIDAVTLKSLRTSIVFTHNDDEHRYAVYLATTDTKEVTTSLEHDDARWVSYDTAMKLLTWPNARDLLRSIREKLINNV